MGDQIKKAEQRARAAELEAQIDRLARGGSASPEAEKAPVGKGRSPREFIQEKMREAQKQGSESPANPEAPES